MSVIKAEYNFTLENGTEIKLRFATWVFREFSQAKGFSVDELLNYLAGTNEEGQRRKFKTEDLISIMFFAAKYVVIIEGGTFTYTDLDVCNWVDELGGITSPKVTELVLVMISGLIQQDSSKVSVEATDKKEDQEKKSA